MAFTASLRNTKQIFNKVINRGTTKPYLIFPNVSEIEDSSADNKNAYIARSSVDRFRFGGHAFDPTVDLPMQEVVAPKIDLWKSRLNCFIGQHSHTTHPRSS